jgi:ribosome-associated toxin RatA of RatAB toxin-antitoxin module
MLYSYVPPLRAVSIPTAMRLEQADLSRLAKGEVVVKRDQSADNPRGLIQAAIQIDSPAPVVWNVMLDCEQVPAFVPGLQSCKVLHNEEETEVVEHQVKFSWYLPTITYTFQAEYTKFKRIDFKRISGGLREFTGSWTLEPVNDGQQTIVTYSVYMDPGFLVPQWLVRNTLLKDLPDVLLSLRKRVSELSHPGKQ